MHRHLCALIIWIAAVAVAASALAADRDSVSQRVRSELAAILKKEAAKLPIDKPVVEFGADDLDVVEWVMAVEEAFRIPIPDDRIVDPKSKATRKELSIAYMTSIVLEGLERAKGKKK